MRTALSVTLPFVLPVAVLLAWMIGQCSGQHNEPQQIVASIDSTGSGTTYLSTIMPDGVQAEWNCTAGSFRETGGTTAWGRSVTWLPGAGLEDSVTIVVTTPSATDSVRFLPMIREMTPAITMSAAYHLATIDRARNLSLAPGTYDVEASSEDLAGYDGLTVLLIHRPGRERSALVVFPGDSLRLELPLGAEISAVGLEDTEEALDNAGSVIITFESTAPPPPAPQIPETTSEEALSDSPPEEAEDTEPTVEGYGTYEDSEAGSAEPSTQSSPSEPDQIPEDTPETPAGDISAEPEVEPPPPSADDQQTQDADPGQ